ncbi:glucosaminidase domain-containing protein [Pseudomonadales bacterium]|nr:glucosaminidase domain-containing protein [Pseudomonadales bacterium]MDB4151125.1 glucosaminidase domain-containing protein [Pseudomonadales bacterium]
MSPVTIFVCLAICVANVVFGILPATRSTPPAQTSQAPLSNATPAIILPVAPYHPSPVMLGSASEYVPPDFTRDGDIQAKKQAFYAYLLPQIDRANQEITRERQWLLNLQARLAQGTRLNDADQIESSSPRLTDNAVAAIHNEAAAIHNEAAAIHNEAAALRRLGKRYNMAAVADAPGALEEYVEQLLLRVDVVPASLVIAQAAKESGWGSSRFAREGNNFFGIWCFNRGCGMTPANRDAGRHHEVAMFDTVQEGVRYYVRTINSHNAYGTLRQIRAAARNNNQPFGGEQLAIGLLRYSERGVLYVNEIQSMIRYNRLQRFTREYSA